MLERFSEEENFMHTQTVSCRKFFVKKTVCDFLERLQHEGRSGQVVILAAGLAPMSVEIASLFPESTVFDVDLHNMREKQVLLGGRVPNIAFCECDITDVEKLDAIHRRADDLLPVAHGRDDDLGEPIAAEVKVADLL